MERLDPFRTPIFTFDLPEIAASHAELTDRLLAERAAHPGVVRSNVGGWHSTPDLTLRPDPCFQLLVRAIVDRADDVLTDLSPDGTRPRVRFGVQAWAMIMGSGDYTTLHDHGEAHLSAVYYVDASSAGRSGLLGFVDPRRGGRHVPGLELGSTFEVVPRTGLLVVFPGWLQHFVHAYGGDKPRISVSANITIEPAR